MAAPDTTQLIGRMGKWIAEHFGVPETEVRLARYTYFDERTGRWTIREVWERRIDGRWVEEEWRPELH